MSFRCREESNSATPGGILSSVASSTKSVPVDSGNRPRTKEKVSSQPEERPDQLATGSPVTTPSIPTSGKDMMSFFFSILSFTGFRIRPFFPFRLTSV